MIRTIGALAAVYCGLKFVGSGDPMFLLTLLVVCIFIEFLA